MRGMKYLTGLLAALAISSQGQGVILTNDFETGSATNVNKYTGRFKDNDLDGGWFANLSNTASEWDVVGGALVNSATNDGSYPLYLPSEGGVLQMVTSGTNTNNVVDISIDYDVASGDTLYVHLWGLDGTIVKDGSNLANFQAGNGAVYDNTDSAADDVVAYALNSGLSKATGLTASSGQAMVGLTGSGTYTNSINLTELLIDGIETIGDFEYYFIAFCKNEDTLPGTTSVDNVMLTTSYEAPPPPAESGIVENPDFPDYDVLASQLEAAQTTDINYTPTSSTMLGQSFSFATAQSLGAITVQKSGDLVVPFDGTNVLTLWIGEYDSTTEPTNHAVGATLYTNSFNISGNSFDDGAFYTFNLSSNLDLTAGTEYAFQLTWTSEDALHSFGIHRYYEGAGGTDTYADGKILYQAGVGGVLPATSLINEPENDMTFALHGSEVPVIAFVEVDPAELNLLFDSTATNTVSGSFDLVYNSATNMDIMISLVNESHTGSFSVVGAASQTLTDPYPATVPFEVVFSNSVAGLVAGTSATGQVLIAWNEAGGGESGSVVIPVAAFAAYAPDANNVFNQTTAGSWGDPNNWSLGRVPGTMGADRAIVQSSGYVCNVDTNFTAPFGFKAWVRTSLGESSVLNIGADFKGASEIFAGQASGQYGMVNQTAGTVETTLVKVGVDGVVASNSYYNLTGGLLVLDTLESSRFPLTLSTNGTLVIDGGTLTMDLDGAFATATLTGGGTVSLKSGSIDLPNGIANSIVKMDTPFAVSGGSLDISGQPRFYSEFKVIGDDATIHFDRMGTYGACSFVFELDETGVSTIDATGGYQSLATCSLTVDGTGYAGSSTSINLFKSSNLNSLIDTNNITITGFAPDVTVEIEQDQSAGVEAVILHITVPGYAGWVGGFGLSGSPDADWDNDYDNDGQVNFYEYAFGGNPADDTSKGHVPTGMMVEDGGTEYFEYVYARRIGTETELDYTALFGTSLGIQNWDAADVVELPTTGMIDAEYESVTNRVDMTGKPVGFMKVDVDKL